MLDVIQAEGTLSEAALQALSTSIDLRTTAQRRFKQPRLMRQSSTAAAATAAETDTADEDFDSAVSESHIAYSLHQGVLAAAPEGPVVSESSHEGNCVTLAVDPGQGAEEGMCSPAVGTSAAVGGASVQLPPAGVTSQEAACRATPLKARQRSSFGAASAPPSASGSLAGHSRREKVCLAENMHWYLSLILRNTSASVLKYVEQPISGLAGCTRYIELHDECKALACISPPVFRLRCALNNLIPAVGH